MVMSLTSYIGTERNILAETAQHCHTMKLPHPILSNRDLEKLRRVSQGDFLATTLPMLFARGGWRHGPGAALQPGSPAALRSPYNPATALLILSDRGVDEECAPIPSLLAMTADAQTTWCADRILDYVQGGNCCPPESFRPGRQPRSQPGQPLLGFRRPRRDHGQAHVFIYWSVQATADDYSDRGIGGLLRGMAQTLAHFPAAPAGTACLSGPLIGLTVLRALSLGRSPCSLC